MQQGAVCVPHFNWLPAVACSGSVRGHQCYFTRDTEQEKLFTLMLLFLFSSLWRAPAAVTAAALWLVICSEFFGEHASTGNYEEISWLCAEADVRNKKYRNKLYNVHTGPISIHPINGFSNDCSRLAWLHTEDVTVVYFFVGFYHSWLPCFVSLWLTILTILLV